MVFKQKNGTYKSAIFIKHNLGLSPKNNFGTTESGGGGGGYTSTNSGGGTNTKTDGDQLNLEGVEPWWAEEDEDEQIINNLTGKALCLYNRLNSSSTGFKNAIKKFDGDFPVSHLSYKINNALPSGNYGVTNPPDNFNITIEFSNTQLSNISDLGGAVAFAHEIIHAEIFRKMLSAAQKGDLDPANMTQQEQVVYINSLRNNFSGIYDYYIERYKPTWNHNQMASHYRGTIADIIKEFDSSNKPSQVYEDLSWVGLRILEDGVTSIAWDGLTQSEKNRVLSNFNTYFFNGKSNCN